MVIKRVFLEKANDPRSYGFFLQKKSTAVAKKLHQEQFEFGVPHQDQNLKKSFLKNLVMYCQKKHPSLECKSKSRLCLINSF